MKLTCDICGSAFRRVAGRIRSDTLGPQTRSYGMLECVSCGLRRIEPRPSAESLKDFYGGHKYYDEAGTDGFNDDGTLKFPAHKLILYGNILDRMESCLQGRPVRALDIGCGWGLFLTAAKERGWEVEGVEPSGVSADYVRERLGMKVFNGLLEEARFNDGAFDAVYIGDVLEHMRDPIPALREARRVLRPGGLLVIKTPNAKSLVDRLDTLYVNFIFMIKPSGNAFLQHLYYFTPSSIRKAVEACGFTHIETSFYQDPFRLKTDTAAKRVIMGIIDGLSVMPRSKACLIAFARRDG